MAIVKLGDIVEIKSHKRIYMKDWVNEGIPFLKVEDIIKLSKNPHHTPNTYINKDLYEEYRSKYEFPKTGDLLLTTGGSVGDVWEYDGRDCWFKDSAIRWLKNDQKVILNKFLKYWILSNKKTILSKLGGSVMMILTSSSINELEINVPSLQEQQAIIDIIEPKEYLFKKYSKYLNIENYDEFISNWKYIIDIIEPFEKILETSTHKLNVINGVFENIYRRLKTTNFIDFNKICTINTTSYQNQKFYFDTSSIGTSVIRKTSEEIVNRKSRANLTVLMDSIIFSKLKGENKLYPIYSENLAKTVFSTGFVNITSKYNAYIYGFLLSEDFVSMKNSNCVGTLMEGINLKILNDWKIPNCNLGKWNGEFNKSLKLINLYNEIITKTKIIISLLFDKLK